MANPPKPKGKEEKSESLRGQAVANFSLPVTVAWILAVAGLLTWNTPAAELLASLGKLAVGASIGLAFVTVVLSAAQDVIPAPAKQRLLYPRGVEQKAGAKTLRHHFPSYWAFSPTTLKKAKLSDSSVPDIKKLQGNPQAQDRLWRANYDAYKNAPSVAHFSARHIAWRDMVPILIILTLATLVVGLVLGWPGGLDRWLYLAAACFGLLLLSWFAGRSSNYALVIVVLEQARANGLKTA